MKKAEGKKSHNHYSKYILNNSVIIHNHWLFEQKYETVDSAVLTANNFLSMKSHESISEQVRGSRFKVPDLVYSHCLQKDINDKLSKSHQSNKDTLRSFSFQSFTVY